MTKSPCCSDAQLKGGSLMPVTLQCVRRCPARADYIELCFESDEGPWTWCFPDPCVSDERVCDGGPLAVTPGPYGARARRVNDGELGFALPIAEALPMILGGSQTFVARKLIERGW
ncbi:hypothetical protein MFTT_47550 [Mycolicibacterium fortuitum subsp. fortuitum]|nr:hypothetical protein MFTT_47550 [Mycolicibacterium fortuitum subsp. fortuitum]CRL58245.1 hypothetical protein CPGR_05588 [Mycolicibacterium fortuitum subsp. fortuitum DSM 46621 = ATCC 6841 = JCM 6387]